MDKYKTLLKEFERRTREGRGSLNSYSGTDPALRTAPEAVTLRVKPKSKVPPGWSQGGQISTTTDSYRFYYHRGGHWVAEQEYFYLPAVRTDPNAFKEKENEYGEVHP